MSDEVWIEEVRELFDGLAPAIDRLIRQLSHSATPPSPAQLEEIVASPPVPLVGNLPYESATPMLRKFVRAPELFSRLVVMVQREVGERLAAGPLIETAYTNSE